MGTHLPVYQALIPTNFRGSDEVVDTEAVIIYGKAAVPDASSKSRRGSPPLRLGVRDRAGVEYATEALPVAHSYKKEPRGLGAARSSDCKNKARL
jgi:hypothetical protein